MIYENYIKRLISESESQIITAYHSSNHTIHDFTEELSEEHTGNSSSRRIDAIFFSNIPQDTWGKYTYKVKLLTKNPFKFNMNTSRLSSIEVQEAFDAVLRGDFGYLIEDLVEYAGVDEDVAENLADEASNADLIILYNSNYANHNIEYIVPFKYYNGKSAKIINEGLI